MAEPPPPPAQPPLRYQALSEYPGYGSPSVDLYALLIAFFAGAIIGAAIGEVFR